MRVEQDERLVCGCEEITSRTSPGTPSTPVLERKIDIRKSYLFDHMA